MDPVPHPSLVEVEVLDEVRTLTERAQARGLDTHTLAYILLETSKEVAMQGDPVTLYDHMRIMETRGRELRQEFERRFGDSLDLEALARGEIKAID
ncbi:MAG: hypothetical protein NXH97_22285 [Rhodobacteraceae bacterium]|nr:hypothetical protein [Paracoccaceae bacterium]